MEEVSEKVSLDLSLKVLPGTVYQELGTDTQGWREQSAGAWEKGRSEGWLGKKSRLHVETLYVMLRVHTISAVDRELAKDFKWD